MREYNKPEFYVEEFRANAAVAGCTSQQVGTEENPEVTVYCSIGGQTETVFSSSVSGCGATTTTDTWGNSYGVADYDNDATDYYAWYTGDTAGSNNRPTTAQQNTLATILNKIFSNHTYTADDGRGWHYGEITYKENAIWGFSW